MQKISSTLNLKSVFMLTRNNKCGCALAIFNLHREMQRPLTFAQKVCSERHFLFLEWRLTSKIKVKYRHSELWRKLETTFSCQIIFNDFKNNKLIFCFSPPLPNGVARLRWHWTDAWPKVWNSWNGGLRNGRKMPKYVRLRHKSSNSLY